MCPDGLGTCRVVPHVLGCWAFLIQFKKKHENGGSLPERVGPRKESPVKTQLADRAAARPVSHGSRIHVGRVPSASSDPILNRALAVMRAEAEAIQAAAQRLDCRFTEAVQLLAAIQGNVIVSGMGKSGHIARKIASTFSSIGTAALFLHPAEAQHGDLGVCRRGDAAILLSKSGSTTELRDLAWVLQERGIPIIAIIGSIQSPLAKMADVALDAGVGNEADAHNIAPSCSTSVALAIGDSLAFSVAEVRGIRAEDFARNHPGGNTGNMFRLCVRDAMTPRQHITGVRPDDSLATAIAQTTAGGLGCVCVLGSDDELQGLITDGDIRRAVQKSVNSSQVLARDVMTKSPVTVEAGDTLYRALQLMNNRPSQISVLLVVEGNRLAGILRVHDIYRAGGSFPLGAL